MDINHNMSLFRKSILKIFGFLITLAICNYSSVADANSDDSALLNKIKSSKILVGATSNDPPWSFVTQDYKFKGIIPDMLRNFLKYQHIDAKVKPMVMPFSSIIPAINGDRADVVADSMYIRPARAKKIDFSRVIFYNPPAIVTQKGNPEHLRKLKDLCGKTTGTYAGTTFIDNLKDENSKCPNNSKMTIKKLETVHDVINAVASSRLDGALIDASIAAYALNENPNLNIDILSNYLIENKAEDNNAIGVKKGNSAFIKKFNHWYKVRKDDGWIKKLFKSWGLKPTDIWLELNP